MSNNSIDSLKSFSDSVKNTTYIIILGLVLIIVKSIEKFNRLNFIFIMK